MSVRSSSRWRRSGRINVRSSRTATPAAANTPTSAARTVATPSSMTSDADRREHHDLAVREVDDTAETVDQGHPDAEQA